MERGKEVIEKLIREKQTIITGLSKMTGSKKLPINFMHKMHFYIFYYN